MAAVAKSLQDAAFERRFGDSEEEEMVIRGKSRRSLALAVAIRRYEQQQV